MIGPLAPGSISLGLSVTAGPAAGAVDRLRETAIAAVEAGFDGVTLSEHHGGFPGYLPTPILVAALLRDRLPRGWAIACPSILPLRSAPMVAEELAWSAAAHPGEIAAGFVPGYQERDFAVTGGDFATRRTRYWRQLAEVTALLSGRTALGEDPALAACAQSPIPVVSGVAGPLGARHAARAGAGLLITSLPDAQEVARVVGAYRAEGGDGPRVLIRRAWTGGTRVAADAKVGRWRDNAGGAAWLAKTPAGVATGRGDEVATHLATDARAGGATALNIRVDVDGAGHAETLAQIATLGKDVLPKLRTEFDPATGK